MLLLLLFGSIVGFFAMHVFSKTDVSEYHIKDTNEYFTHGSMRKHIQCYV